MESKDLAKKEETALANPFDGAGASSSTLDATDIDIPRLHLLQGLSGGVAEGDFKLGDILHTGHQEVVGHSKEAVEIIPIHIAKVNQKFRTDVNPKEYICTEEFAMQEWEEPSYTWEKRDGQVLNCKVNNYKTFIVHAVIVSDDMDMALPVSITFRSSAGKDGRKIASHFATVMQFNQVKQNVEGFVPQPPYNVTWNLSSELVKDGSSTFSKWVCKRGRKTTDEEKAACREWEIAIAANAAKYASQAGDSENVKEEEKEVKTAPPQESEIRKAKNHAPQAAGEELPF